MTEVIMNKLKLVGSGYAEMPQNGRRYRFHIERYRHDDGTEFGRVVSMEEIPDVGPYLYIPSYGVEADEAQHMFEEHQYEQAHPDPLEQEWLAEHRADQGRQRQRYDELRDRRAEVIRRNWRTLGGQG